MANKVEVLPGDELLGYIDSASVFTPTMFSLGYIYDFHLAEHVQLGIGRSAKRYIVPKGLDAAYGSDPAWFMTFARLKVHRGATPRATS